MSEALKPGGDDSDQGARSVRTNFTNGKSELPINATFADTNTDHLSQIPPSVDFMENLQKRLLKLQE